MPPAPARPGSGSRTSRPCGGKVRRLPCASSPRWRCSQPAVEPSAAALPCPKRLPKTLRIRCSSLTSGIHCRLDLTYLRSDEIGRNVEPEGCLGEHPHFAVDAHVVAVVLQLQTLNFGYLRRSAVDRLLKLVFKVHVARSVAGRVGIRDVGAD